MYKAISIVKTLFIIILNKNNIGAPRFLGIKHIDHKFLYR